MYKEYTGPGCYRFLDELENVIYIGSAKNIHRRFKSHFIGKKGHLGSNVYNQVARFEICKCEDYPTALAMEQFLINKYKPRFNKKDKAHNMNSKVVKNEKVYEDLEHWKLYYRFKPLDKEKIKTNKVQDIMLIAVCYTVFILGILMFAF